MKPDKHPFAVNIRKLQRYNFEFFTTEEAVFFEYIVVKSKLFNGEFYHSGQTIRQETGIKRSALNTIVSRFQALGIFKVEVKGMPSVRYFWVDYRKIIELLPQIYLLNSDLAKQTNLHQLLLDYLVPQMNENEEVQKGRETREREKLQNLKPEVIVEDVGAKVERDLPWIFKPRADIFKLSG